MCDKKLSSAILIWVDDIIIATGSKKFMNRIKDDLKGKFKMKDMGKINCFLRIQFVQSKSKIEMDQSRYLQNILRKYGMFDCKPRSTPCEMSLSASHSVSDSSLSDNPRVYHEIVGSFLGWWQPCGTLYRVCVCVRGWLVCVSARLAGECVCAWLAGACVCLWRAGVCAVGWCMCVCAVCWCMCVCVCGGLVHVCVCVRWAGACVCVCAVGWCMCVRWDGACVRGIPIQQ